MIGLLSPSAVGIVQLEGPQKVGHLLKVWSDGRDLVHNVFNADDAVFAERLLYDGIVVERLAGLVDLAVASLVHKLSHRLQIGVALKK